MLRRGMAGTTDSPPISSCWLFSPRARADHISHVFLTGSPIHSLVSLNFTKTQRHHSLCMA